MEYIILDDGTFVQINEINDTFANVNLGNSNTYHLVPLSLIGIEVSIKNYFNNNKEAT